MGKWLVFWYFDAFVLVLFVLYLTHTDLSCFLTVELTVAIGLAFFFLHIAIFKLISTYGLAGFHRYHSFMSVLFSVSSLSLSLTAFAPHRQGRLVIFAYYFMFVSLFIMIYWWVIKGLRCVTSLPPKFI